MIAWIRRVLVPIRAFGRRVQAVALRGFLAALYLFGFGITRLYALVFHRALLQRAPPRSSSYWQEASGYSTDAAERRLQS